MIRSTIPLAAMLLLGACNVTDNNNGSSTISLDENRIDAGADMVANEAAEAGDKAADVLRNAGPEIEQSASDIKERAGRVADKAEALGDEIDSETTTPAEANKAR